MVQSNSLVDFLRPTHTLPVSASLSSKKLFLTSFPSCTPYCSVGFVSAPHHMFRFFQVVVQPALESTGNAILAWLHAQQSHELGRALVGRKGVVSHQMSGHRGLSLSAQAAVHVHLKVKRLVGMMQLHEVRPSCGFVATEFGRDERWRCGMIVICAGSICLAMPTAWAVEIDGKRSIGALRVL